MLYFKENVTKPTPQPSNKDSETDVFARNKELGPQSLETDLFNHTPVGYIVLNLEGRVLTHNISAGQLLNENNLRGKNLGLLVADDSKSLFTNHLKLCFQALPETRLECELDFHVSESPKRVTCRVTSTVSSDVIRMSLLDLAETKRANFYESMTKDLNDEKALRDNFVATLSHDLRAPLNSAKLCTQMLMVNLKEHLTSAKVNQLFELQLEELSRADLMIKELLDANKIKDKNSLQLTMKKCCLDKVARKVIELICSTYKDEVTIKYKVSGDVTGVWAKEALHRVLENLIINSIKYGSTEMPISVSLEAGINNVSLMVHNFGTPIPLGSQKNIFEAFHRTAEATASSATGWGLGLNLVNNIVQKHGGEIKLNSTLKDGTSFEVLLPKYKAVC